jgi:uncharacterized protein (DUF433 family)
MEKESTMSPVTVSHIWLDDRGVAWIDDTNVKVIEVAMEKRATGMSPEEMEFQHYGNLSLSQIHAALMFYYDHQAELDAEIERQSREYEALRAQALDSPGRQRLRAQGKLP